MAHIKPIYRTILDIDSPTRAQIHKALQELRKQNQEKSNNTILALPRKHTKVVSCCGTTKYKTDLVEYYGELFCADCVDAWKNGAVL